MSSIVKNYFTTKKYTIKILKKKKKNSIKINISYNFNLTEY